MSTDAVTIQHTLPTPQPPASDFRATASKAPAPAPPPPKQSKSRAASSSPKAAPSSSPSSPSGLSSFDACQIIRRAKSYQEAFLAFQRCLNNPKSAPTAFLFQAIFSAAIRFRSGHLALGLWSDAERTGSTSAHVLSTFIKMCSEIGALTEAFSAFESAQRQGIKLDLPVFRAVVALCRDGRQPERSFGVWEAAVRAKIPLDIGFFRYCLDTAASVDDWQRCVALYRSAHSVKLQLPLEVYGLVIAVGRRTKNAQQALELWESRTPKIPPDSLLLRNLILCAAESSRGSAEAFRLYSQARATVTPDIRVLQVLLDIAKQDSNMAQVSLVLEELTRLHLEPDAVFATTLLTVLLQHDQIVTARVFDAKLPVGLRVDEGVTGCRMRLFTELGDLNAVHRCFAECPTAPRSLHLWTMLIDAHGRTGNAEDALKLFTVDFQASGIPPDERLFTVVLQACSHAFLHERASEIFRSMVSFGVTPNVVQWGCLIDAYARSGRLEDAQRLISEMPTHGVSPDAVIWMTLLGAARLKNDISVGEQAYAVLQKDFPNSRECSTATILMDELYSRAGRVEEQQLMRARRGPKIPGITMLHSDTGSLSFHAHDAAIDKMPGLRDKLMELRRRLDQAGHTPDLSLVTVSHSLSEEEKQWNLCTHSERIAIAAGLLHGSSKIHLTKNLRVCTDCHAASCAISKLYNVEILVRDANRYHRISNGECSCHGKF